MTDIHNIRSLEDFVEPVKELIDYVINANYKTIQDRGWMSSDRLETVIDLERENYFTYWMMEGRKIDPMEAPEGLFWLAVPPDDLIKNSIAEAIPLSYDKSDPFFNCQAPKHTSQRIRKICNDEFLLGDILDNKTPVPDSEWHADIRLWTRKGKRSMLTLKLEMYIKSGQLSLKIEGIEVM